ncbi:piggyBac transposable element-derived protein 4-like [Salmo trutta]|uniref:piggyBac transposable element-derived protein 4-like n=1 Tax=Salmo trutta TaxID=8032 RepID=UPI0011309CCE|nr:piggyBac transposable element-derived protein 4-like [Salmo trutta]
MTVRFTAQQVLENIFSHVQQDYSDSEQEEAEDVSEDEDGEEYNPEHDASLSSEEEQQQDIPQAEREKLLSKNDKIRWSSVAAYHNQNELSWIWQTWRACQVHQCIETRETASDKLAAIREVWDEWVARLLLLYNPGPDVTVDEQLVPFRGCCPFRQYMPSKPAKYGIKSWVACDAKSSYAWKMQVYTGKPTSGGPEKNQGMRVVLDVTEGLRGHNVTCDNFFTSYELRRQLLRRNVTMVGMVRKNKPELPPALLAAKDREVFSSRFAFTPTTTLVSYLPKKNKNVLLLSTLHTGVIGMYSCRRMTARWPLERDQPELDAS